MWQGFIYLITNQINKKIYVGQTTNSLKKRFIQHKCASVRVTKKEPIHLAMFKYGSDNFVIEPLLIIKASSKEELCRLLNDSEKSYIAALKSYGYPHGYNATPGGNQYIMSEKQKLKISQLTNH